MDKEDHYGYQRDGPALRPASKFALTVTLLEICLLTTQTRAIHRVNDRTNICRLCLTPQMCSSGARGVSAVSQLLDSSWRKPWSEPWSTVGAQQALRSTMEKRREVRHNSEHLGEWLLGLPLGVKVPVPPRSEHVFTRGKLGKKLHQPSSYFNLGDPCCRQLSTEYNCLHDPHLKSYFHRKDNFQSLKRDGFITSDSRVVCSLKEYNEYRNYLTRLRLDIEEVARREEERLRTRLATFKDASKPGDTSCPVLRLQQAQSKLCPSPPKQRTSSFKGEGRRRGKGARDKEHTKSQPGMGQEGAKLPGSVRRFSQSGPVLTPELSRERPVAKPPAERGRTGSSVAEDGLLSTGPDFSRQPVPPAYPKPSGPTGAQRRGLRFKPLSGETQTPTSEGRSLPGRFVDTLLGCCVPKDV